MYDKKINKIFKYISKLKQTIEFEEKLFILANMAKDILDADRCSIWSYSPQKQEFITKFAHGVDILHIPVSDGIIGHCFLTKEPIIYDDVYECEFFDSSIDKKTGYRTKSLITLPILDSKGEIIGIFQALNKKTKDEKFTKEDLEILDLIIIYISEVLESTILYEELQKKNKIIDKYNKELEEKVKQRTKELNKQKQKAEALTKAKSNFLANMSHEIRTPLNAIMGFIDIVKENEEDEENAQYLNIVKNSSESLLNIINDILDFSKIESGNLSLEITSFNLKELIEEIGLLFYEKAREKYINIKINFDKNSPQEIEGDPIRLKQIFINLIGNAIKFTNKDGEINLNIEYNKNINKLTFKVKDTGIGISPKNIDHIFKPFLQEDSSTTRKFGGTGLGLTISYDLIKLMGGELKVKSELGVGSEFYFSLNIKESKEKKMEKKIEKVDIKEFDFKNKKILLAEDNKANQLFMKVLLKKIGLELDIANDGLEAVKMFEENRYDAILMDENMPNMNGIEATKIILDIENSNKLKHTPIIALTANAIKGDRERFLEAGMDEYLTKPVNKDKLVQTLLIFLSKA